MSWTSTLFACVVPASAATAGEGARQVIASCPDPSDHVVACSRNGALPRRLASLLSGSPRGSALYLLADEAVLSGAGLRVQWVLLGHVLDTFEREPRLVVEATRERHEPTGLLLAEGFRPLPFEWVYPPGARIEEGWVYFHTEASVRALLAGARCGADPRPPGDDDGESLQFAFALLKSHRALLRKAIDADAAVAFAEMSE